MQQIGGKDKKNCTINILKYLFKDEVLQQFTFGGTKEKGTFKNFIEINNLIKMANRKQFENYTDEEHKIYMQDYLKQAKFRIINLSKKNAQ